MRYNTCDTITCTVAAKTYTWPRVADGAPSESAEGGSIRTCWRWLLLVMGKGTPVIFRRWRRRRRRQRLATARVVGGGVGVTASAATVSSAGAGWGRRQRRRGRLVGVGEGSVGVGGVGVGGRVGGGLAASAAVTMAAGMAARVLGARGVSQQQEGSAPAAGPDTRNRTSNPNSWVLPGRTTIGGEAERA